MESETGFKGALVSYVTLRRIIGVLGVGLPIILLVWGWTLSDGAPIQASISDYYGLRTRDAFVGILFTIAWFMFAYRGYEPKDDIAGDTACVLALCVALFPNSGSSVERIVHFGAALSFFLVLAYFSLYLFTKSERNPTPEKLARNRVYRFCGVAILVFLALIGIYYWMLRGTAVSRLQPVFWLETLALWAFGISWFVKGETILRDK